AGRRAAVVAARLERDVGRRAAGVGAATLHISERAHFGMSLTGALVPTLADHPTVAHQHAADTRVGRSRVPAIARQFDGAGHVLPVLHRQLSSGSISISDICRSSRRGSASSRSISARMALTSLKSRYTEAKRT